MEQNYLFNKNPSGFKPSDSRINQLVSIAHNTCNPATLEAKFSERCGFNTSWSNILLIGG